MNLETEQDVLDAMLSSDRVCADDLPLALEHARHTWSQHIVLREWISIPAHGELRAFVVDGRLTAVAQYFSGVFFAELADAEARARPLIDAFFEKIREKVQLDPVICIYLFKLFLFLKKKTF